MKRFSKKRFTQMKRSEKWFARVPAQVLFDEQLSLGAKVAYGIIALGVEKDSAAIGMRLLGKLAGGRSAATAMRWIRELSERGHLVSEKGMNGARGLYGLTSPVFHGGAMYRRQPLQDASPDGVHEPQTSEIQNCSHCRRPVKRAGSAGLCRGCVEEIQLRDRVRMAQLEIGAGATPEALAIHLKSRRLAVKIRKLLQEAAA